tara:strand:+ start:34 stop:438 length:405 start_codon:yes stop_codon:yes gene_type:complete
MANYVYDKAAGALWGADIAFDTDTIQAYLVDTALYTPDKVNDEFLSDIPVGARTITPVSLASKTITGRVIDAADVVFPTVAAGADREAVILVQDTGVEATSRLLIHADTATGLPVTPNGQDITVIWNASGIATL